MGVGFFSWKFVATSRASLCCMLNNAFDLVTASVSHRYVKSRNGSRLSCTACCTGGEENHTSGPTWTYFGIFPKPTLSYFWATLFSGISALVAQSGHKFDQILI